jgi:uncharacterized protein
LVPFQVLELPVQFNVAQLLNAPIGTSRAFDVATDVKRIDEHSTARPVIGAARLTRTKRGVLVDARLGTAVRLQCGRCLEDVESALAVHIEEEFLPTIDVATGLSVTLDREDEEAFRIDDDHVLNLEEPLRQYALLEIPLQPLCRPDCRGLCALCGRNRNLASCACRPELTDERLAPLGSLLEQLDRKE